MAGPAGQGPRRLVSARLAGAGRAAGTRLHLRLRINQVGRRAPWLVARIGGLIDEATVRPLFAGLAERLR